MCGIAGSFNSTGVDKNEIVKMCDVINYRGPDDEGYVYFDSVKRLTEVSGGKDTADGSWNANLVYTPRKDKNQIIDTNHLAFGHRRLSILDLSAFGHQPMCDSTERYWITYNGEIYNYIEIRQELINLGQIFNTNTDTEVILNAYKEWGINCQDKFMGMWAFVIHDTLENTIFLSRDRFGIKPLYYWISSSNTFYFASEIKQFTVCENWRSVLNHQRANDFLFYSLTDHTDETLFEGVFQLKSGYSSIIKLDEYDFTAGNKIHSFKWYNPIISKFKGSFEDAKVQFKNLLTSSVDLHLRSDVIVGSALSGGLDSSSIVCIVDNLLKEKEATTVQNTFSSVHENEKYSEKKWVDEVLHHTSVNPHFIYPKYEELVKTLPNLIWHMDEPYQSQSAFLANQVFSKAKQQKITVVLNGQGADEYLSGYGEFRNLRLVNYVKRLEFKKLKEELDLSYFKLCKYSIQVLSRHLYDSISGKLRFYLASRSANYKMLHSLLDLSLLKSESLHPKDTFEYDKNSHVGISQYQLYSNPLPRYLRWEDRNSMCHSIEARVPFLDHRLIEFCHSLPLEYLDSKGSTKRLLSEAMNGVLPDKIKNRKDKQGFITPEEDWVRFKNTADFRELLIQSIKNSHGIIKIEALSYFDAIVEGKIPFDYTYWRLILFGIWIKEFKIELQ